MSEVPLYPPHPTQVLRELSSKSTFVAWKVDVRLPGEGDSNSHGARPVQLMLDVMTQVLRELSAKSLVYLVPKLSERVINSQVLRALCALLQDSEGSIRFLPPAV